MKAPTACVAVGRDGQRWTVTRRMTWRAPATADDFDHDVQTGWLAAWILVGLVAFGLLWLVFNMPDDPYASRILLGLVLLFGFFPARWLVRRPWTIVAETGDVTVERWVGTVRGFVAARHEVARTVHAIETDSAPPLEGQLTPVV